MLFHVRVALWLPAVAVRPVGAAVGVISWPVRAIQIAPPRAGRVTVRLPPALVAVVLLKALRKQMARSIYILKHRAPILSRRKMIV